MYDEALHEMKAAEILDKTFSVFKKTFWIQIAYNILVNIMTIPIAIFFAIAVFFMFAIFGITANIFDNFASFEISAIFVIGLIFICLLAFLVILCTTTIKVIGEMLIAKQMYDGIKPDVGNVIKSAFSKLLATLSAVIAESICLLPVVLIAILLEAIVLGIIHISVGINLQADVFQIIICLIVPIIASIAIFYFNTIWLFAVPVAIFDNIKFFKALNKSKQLMKGSLKQILGIRIIWFLSQLAFNYAVFILIYLIIMGVSETFDSFYFIAEAINVIIQNFATLILLVITKPLTSILTFILYYNQRVKNEGLDIQIKLERMEI